MALKGKWIDKVDGVDYVLAKDINDIAHSVIEVEDAIEDIPENGGGGSSGKDGVTFTPQVSSAGIISWTNNGGLDNPAPANIKGPKGDPYTLTETDKTLIVAQVIESLGGNPIFGYVDEDNNIIVQGNLGDGTYSVKYEMEDGSTVDIGNLVLDTNVYYSITKNLTNCVIDNSATQVVAGGSYSATITANNGYTLDTVSVTMGGSAVSVSGGVVSIESVTGDIVITAVASEAVVEPSYTNLAEPDENATGQAAWESGGWCNDSYMAGSSYAYRAATDGKITTNTIAVEKNDVIYVKGIKYNEASFPQIAVFNSEKTYLKHGYAALMESSHGFIDDLTATVDSDTWSFTNSGAGGADVGVRYIRISGLPSGDIADIIITRNEPIV